MNNYEENKFNYVKETIVDKKKRKKQKMKKALLVIMALIILGSGTVLAIGQFFWDRPIDESTLSENETGEPLKVILDGSQGKNLGTDQYAKLKEIGEESGSYMVTVRAVVSDEDWIDSYMEGEGVTSGIIVSIGKEIRILTDYDTIQHADTIVVKFQNGDVVRARILGNDTNSGISFLTLDSDELKSDTRKRMTEAPIGEATASEPGTPAIIVGNPCGENVYMTLCLLTSTSGSVHTTDDSYGVLLTDAAAVGRENGFIINAEGRVIGMISPVAKKQDPGGVLAGLYISDIREIMDHLAEQEEMVFLGVNGQEITDEIRNLASREMPQGIYVKSTGINSPAFEVGIAGGDIIVRMDGKSVSTFQNYEDILGEKRPGDEIEVAIMRKVRDGYEEYRYTVILGKR
ncbi:S1C family serine protease [Parasporobacterium paucivorans]|uniref:Serine protease, S1-C subfamily, contains C-terminal PDZ domain n=1 Tax=Parasporobacterium paucivorans DSM 15970 TaxID=1122934 RepID=A0A1M6CVU1_9FIRM|nr:trypsin-like peptidase domain-containing protein [Parasporobacterium paucivorans]SHI65079.1 serine protease, S1-C subfamily, contains C-terminal PDZ domain [Parasporobacterium paucivorans DSM 15970]